jgi:hypothetical protein
MDTFCADGKRPNQQGCIKVLTPVLTGIFTLILYLMFVLAFVLWLLTALTADVRATTYSLFVSNFF